MSFIYGYEDDQIAWDDSNIPDEEDAELDYGYLEDMPEEEEW